MPPYIRSLVLVLASAAGAACGDDAKPYAGCAAAADAFFTDEVWAKVGAQSCLTCHAKGGDAEESQFRLLDPRKSPGRSRAAAQPRRLRPDGAGQGERRVAAVAEGRRRAQARRRGRPQAGLRGVPHPRRPSSAGWTAPRRGRRTPSPRPRPRRRSSTASSWWTTGGCCAGVTLSLAGRLPTDAELAAVAAGGSRAVPRAARRRDEGGRLLRPAPRGVQRHLPHAAASTATPRPDGALLRPLQQVAALVSEVRPRAASPTRRSGSRPATSSPPTTARPCSASR